MCRVCVGQGTNASLYYLPASLGKPGYAPLVQIAYGPSPLAGE